MNEAANDRDRAFVTIPIFCSILSVGMATVYGVARIGFDNPGLPVATSAALSISIATAPYILRRIITIRGGGYSWATSYSFLWLACLAASAAAGRLVTVLDINPVYPAVLAGVVGFLVVLVRWLRRIPPLRSATLVVGAGVFSIWAAGVVWGLIYKSPLFVESLVHDGLVHHDGLALAAYANMLKTYGVASNGLDGLPYVPYHWGSQWLFAQLSNLLDISVLDFYQMAFPITMVPLFFGGVLAFATELRVRRGDIHPLLQPTRAFFFWTLFLAATVGFLPIEALDAMGVWTSNLMISESYTVAVPAALLLLATTIVFWSGSGRRMLDAGRVRPGDAVFMLAVLPGAMAGLGYLKISLMVLAFALAVYAALRLRLYTRPIWLAAIALALLFVLSTYSQVSLPAHREGFAALDFLTGYIAPAWWPFFFFVHLFWSWLYIGLRLAHERLRTTEDLWQALRERRLLDVEAVALVAICGIVPGLILHIDGGSAFYFSDVQRWLALGMLLGSPAIWLTRVVRAGKGARGMRSVYMLAAFLAFPFVMSMAFNAVVWTKKMAQDNAAIRRGLYPVQMASAITPGARGLPQLGDRRLLAEGLTNSKNFRAVDGLRKLSLLPLSERRRTALFIAQSERAYWDILTRPGACTFASFVAPAIAGMAMVDGMPGFGCKLSPYYGLGSYVPRTRRQTSADEAPTVLCSRARASRLSRILVLKFDTASAMKATVVECSSRFLSIATPHFVSSGE